MPNPIDHIARELWRPIPRPYTPPPKPQASWATLKPSQHLATRVALLTPSTGPCPIGTRFEVTATDSEGATLEVLPLESQLGLTDPTTLGILVGGSLRLTDREWQGRWERVRRPSRRRAAK